MDNKAKITVTIGLSLQFLLFIYFIIIMFLNP